MFEYWLLLVLYWFGCIWKCDLVLNNGSWGKFGRGVSWLKGSDGICNIVCCRILKFYGYCFDWFGGIVDCSDCVVECCDGVWVSDFGRSRRVVDDFVSFVVSGRYCCWCWLICGLLVRCCFGCCGSCCGSLRSEIN